MSAKYKNADAARADSLRKQAAYQDALAAYHEMKGNEKAMRDYIQMAAQSREYAARWQLFADNPEGA